MVKCGPAVGVEGVEVGVAIGDDGHQSDLLLRLDRKDSFVNRCLSSNAHALINLITAVDQVL